MRVVVGLLALLVILAVGGFVVLGFTPLKPSMQTVEQKIDDQRLPR